jgi:hypothetical protein
MYTESDYNQASEKDGNSPFKLRQMSKESLESNYMDDDVGSKKK